MHTKAYISTKCKLYFVSSLANNFYDNHPINLCSKFQISCSFSNA